jgi:hypothetical protein
MQIKRLKIQIQLEKPWLFCRDGTLSPDLDMRRGLARTKIELALVIQLSFH